MGPHRGHQCALVDVLPRVSHEILEHIEGPGTQGDRLPVGPQQAALDAIQVKPAEGKIPLILFSHDLVCAISYASCIFIR